MEQTKLINVSTLNISKSQQMKFCFTKNIFGRKMNLEVTSRLRHWKEIVIHCKSKYYSKEINNCRKRHNHRLYSAINFCKAKFYLYMRKALLSHLADPERFSFQRFQIGQLRAKWAPDLKCPHDKTWQLTIDICKVECKIIDLLWKLKATTHDLPGTPCQND